MAHAEFFKRKPLGILFVYLYTYTFYVKFHAINILDLTLFSLSFIILALVFLSSFLLLLCGLKIGDLFQD